MWPRSKQLHLREREYRRSAALFTSIKPKRCGDMMRESNIFAQNMQKSSRKQPSPRWGYHRRRPDTATDFTFVSDASSVQQLRRCCASPSLRTRRPKSGANIDRGSLSPSPGRGLPTSIRVFLFSFFFCLGRLKKSGREKLGQPTANVCQMCNALTTEAATVTFTDPKSTPTDRRPLPRWKVWQTIAAVERGQGTWGIRRLQYYWA